MKTPGSTRGHLLYKLAALMDEHADRLAAVETLDVGKTFLHARHVDVAVAIGSIRYFAGWADKNHGKVMEVSQNSAYLQFRPLIKHSLGSRGQARLFSSRANRRLRPDHSMELPTYAPLLEPSPSLTSGAVLMFAWKIGPALATGNTVVLKPSEISPLSSLYFTSLIEQIGFPPGVVNVVNGYGNTVGSAISSHMDVDKVAFTGSTLVGRRIMEAAARSNLKNVTLELGGKGPSIVFGDADLDKAVGWASHGIL
jgi:aldehyde dehydrogenase (NAD+)